MIKSPEFVNLVCVVFGNDVNYRIKDVVDTLEYRFGKIDFISKPLDFSEFTSYYEEEMGKPQSHGEAGYILRMAYMRK